VVHVRDGELRRAVAAAHEIEVADDDHLPGAVAAVFGDAGLDRGAGWKGRGWS
jgi:hypothetical protein